MASTKKTQELKTGPRGPKGNQGNQGNPGEEGEQGETGTIEKFVVGGLIVIVVALVVNLGLSLKDNRDNDKQTDDIGRQADQNTALNELQSLVICDIAIILQESPAPQGPLPGQSVKSYKRQLKAAAGLVETANLFDCKAIVTHARAGHRKAVQDAVKRAEEGASAKANTPPPEGAKAPGLTVPTQPEPGQNPRPPSSQPAPGAVPQTPTVPTPTVPSDPVSNIEDLVCRIHPMLCIRQRQ